MHGMMAPKRQYLMLRRLRREGLNGSNGIIGRWQGPTKEIARSTRTTQTVWRIRAGAWRDARQKAAGPMDRRRHLGCDRLMDRDRAGMVVMRVRLSQRAVSGFALRRFSITLLGMALAFASLALPQIHLSHLTLAIQARGRSRKLVRRWLSQRRERLRS